jgi:mannose-6-phosphate isomerase-like protein (cupin superfamily)
MSERAFLIAGDRAAVVANDIADARYHAAVHYVPVGVQVPIRSHSGTEMQFMLEDGMLEFMVGGAATTIAAPSLIRVPPDVPYAYRNIGDDTARLLVRAAQPVSAVKMVHVSIEYAA